ncbi:AAEL004303-PA [Aedes aegypti]|uniref:AAEL004303-PA n=1 Tax=Aedes aegypti TaxID=7159 RepID=Q17DA9_AEDAE|nr:AAEL004303-PA [Aedes aegypti]
MILTQMNVLGLASSWLVIHCILHVTSSELETFDYCIRTSPSVGLLQCAGQQALASLQFLEEANNLTLGSGIMMIKDESNPAARILPNFLDHDPMDFRGILENAGAVISQRQLMWDMGIIYPGLKLKIGPTLGANGVLEFVMDPASNGHNDERTFFEEKSTARILTRNFVVPFLLGLKFNLATLLPLIFGGLILLSKKALILGKIALFVSGLFGYGSIFTPGIGYGLGYPTASTFGGLGSYGGFHHKPFRYGDALSDKPDWESHQQHHHHHKPQSDSLHQSYYGGGSPSTVSTQADDSVSSGYYKKQDKFLNLDERLEAQSSALVDKFYDYEKQQMMKDRTSSFRSCFADIGFVDCAKNVLVRMLNNAINSNAVVRVTRFLVIRKNPDFILTEADERTPADWHTLISKVRDFLDSRSIQLSLVAPDGRSLIPFGAEARGKKHKHKHQGGMYMMGGVAFMAMMAQLVLGKVALLAAVALIMAKIALVFSTLNGFKKAAAASGGGEHVVYESGHGSGSVGGSGWQRSIEPKRQTGGGTSGGGGQWDDDENVPYRRRRPDYDYSLDGAR